MKLFGGLSHSACEGLIYSDENRAAATTTLILERQEGRNQIFSTSFYFTLLLQRKRSTKRLNAAETLPV